MGRKGKGENRNVKEFVTGVLLGRQPKGGGTGLRCLAEKGVEKYEGRLGGPKREREEDIGKCHPTSR